LVINNSELKLLFNIVQFYSLRQCLISNSFLSQVLNLCLKSQILSFQIQIFIWNWTFPSSQLLKTNCWTLEQMTLFWVLVKIAPMVSSKPSTKWVCHCGAAMSLLSQSLFFSFTCYICWKKGELLSTIIGLTSNKIRPIINPDGVSHIKTKMSSKIMNLENDQL
jgi:hypothetical protein